MFEQYLIAIWTILPAYFANAFPVIGYKLLGKYNRPISAKWLGEGKTIGGFFFGLLIGSLVGFLQGALLLGFLLSLGALTGDIFGSFIKRRIGLKRGASAPGLDQLGFLVFALIFSWPILELTTLQIVFLLVLTPVLHLGANLIAFSLKLKKEWW